MLEINIISHQPEYYPGPLLKGILGVEYGLSYHINFHSCPKNGLYTKPYGQTKGLCLNVEKLDNFIHTIYDNTDSVLFIIPSPDGYRINEVLPKLLQSSKLCIICPRYTGIDHRFQYCHKNVLHVSLGDYIVSNGDLACIVILDALIRLIVLKQQRNGLVYDTTYHKLYALPIYTYPRVYKGLSVPTEYLAGNSKRIETFNKLTILHNTLKDTYNLSQNSSQSKFRSRYTKSHLYRTLLKHQK